MLFAETGYTFYRRYELYESKDQLVANSFYDKTENGMLVNTGISIRIRQDNKNGSPLKVAF